MKLRFFESHPESFILMDRGTFSHAFMACRVLHFEEYRWDGWAASGPVVWRVQTQRGAALGVHPRDAVGIPVRRFET